MTSECIPRTILQMFSLFSISSSSGFSFFSPFTSTSTPQTVASRTNLRIRLIPSSFPSNHVTIILTTTWGYHDDNSSQFLLSTCLLPKYIQILIFFISFKAKGQEVEEEDAFGTAFSTFITFLFNSLSHT